MRLSRFGVCGGGGFWGVRLWLTYGASAGRTFGPLILFAVRPPVAQAVRFVSSTTAFAIIWSQYKSRDKSDY